MLAVGVVVVVVLCPRATFITLPTLLASATHYDEEYDDEDDENDSKNIPESDVCSFRLRGVSNSEVVLFLYPHAAVRHIYTHTHTLTHSISSIFPNKFQMRSTWKCKHVNVEQCVSLPVWNSKWIWLAGWLAGRAIPTRRWPPPILVLG